MGNEGNITQDCLDPAHTFTFGVDHTKLLKAQIENVILHIYNRPSQLMADVLYTSGQSWHLSGTVCNEIKLGLY